MTVVAPAQATGMSRRTTRLAARIRPSTTVVLSLSLAVAAVACMWLLHVMSCCSVSFRGANTPSHRSGGTVTRTTTLWLKCDQTVSSLPQINGGVCTATPSPCLSIVESSVCQVCVCVCVCVCVPVCA